MIMSRIFSSAEPDPPLTWTAMADLIAEKPTHIYKKWDFSNGNSMGIRRSSRGGSALVM
jgi:hypothetical protein